MPSASILQNRQQIIDLLDNPRAMKYGHKTALHGHCGLKSEYPLYSFSSLLGGCIVLLLVKKTPVLSPHGLLGKNEI